MKLLTRKTPVIMAAMAALTLTLAACGDDDGDDSTASGNGDSTSAPEEETTEPADEPADEMTEEPMAGPVGPGCADYASQVPDGEGSVEGMSDDPVAVAASNNPILTTLVSAVSGQLNPQVNLVDTLNGAEFTVFAPVDDAFAAVDQGTLDTLATDADLLTTVLTYHVVPGQLSPDQVVGEQATVQGAPVTVAGTADALTVNGANVICGGVTTANATVYLIDGVLMPPM
ncbi:fasciclin domain-containing protein [Jiangella alkaliphila]|uniref:Uncaracterized surface protein containing fasciclin (FAS1) repeats n=1 Tax=Jiangella alkaliphila TaxID=419479 RepID=A0A1H2LEW1_9ACTN|nr:fasciclin domain-containing protein [Jiangella alkaliphila]SDU79567.1 Uncaracterized surface protein containing fasciclin (FAS1) repeats [Jiangella alkaliphila]